MDMLVMYVPSNNLYLVFNFLGLKYHNHIFLSWLFMTKFLPCNFDKPDFGFLFLQNALRQQRFVREVTIQYNLCNEPWYVCHIFVEHLIWNSSYLVFLKEVKRDVLKTISLEDSSLVFSFIFILIKLMWKEFIFVFCFIMFLATILNSSSVFCAWLLIIVSTLISATGLALDFVISFFCEWFFLASYFLFALVFYLLLSLNFFMLSKCLQDKVQH